jgi:hypothetical protein
MAYEKLTGPLGGRRGDVQMAILAAVITNSQRGKGQRIMTPADFLPAWDGKRRTMSPEEMFAAAMKANAALGGAVRVNS